MMLITHVPSISLCDKWEASMIQQLFVEVVIV